MGSVLVVDHTAGNARLLEALLASDGHDVTTAGDGVEALQTRYEPNRPISLLMEVTMPQRSTGWRRAGR